MLDFIKDEEWQDPRPPDQVTGEPGALNLDSDTKDQEAATKVEEDQTVDDESKGEEDYKPDGKQPPQLITKFGAAVAKALTPQPVATPEDDAAFLTETDIQQQVRDFLRYIATQAFRVVEVPAANFKVWKHTCTDAPQLIAGLQPNRQSLTLRVADADTVYIADERGHCTSSEGYQLTGETIEIKAKSEVWILGASGDEEVSVKGEYYA